MQNKTWSNLITAQHQQSIKGTRRKGKKNRIGGNNRAKLSSAEKPQAAAHEGKHTNSLATLQASPNPSTRAPSQRSDRTIVEWRNFKIYSRQSSPPPNFHQLKCSSSQDSFTVDPYCNSGGINSGGQWPIPGCAGSTMCHHQQMQMPHLPVLAHGPSMTSLHGQFPPPPLCNPCSSQQQNNFNSVPLPGPSRWGPRTSCPVHSPFRARIPNGTICSGHQVKQTKTLSRTFASVRTSHIPTHLTESEPVDGGVYGREFYRFSFALGLRLTGCSNDCDDDNSREESRRYDNVHLRRQSIVAGHSWDTPPPSISCAHTHVRLYDQLGL